MLPRRVVSLLTEELIARRQARKHEAAKAPAANETTPFLQALLSAVKDQYADRIRLFFQLDQKAQITAALA
jgi:hypothetical protein